MEQQCTDPPSEDAVSALEHEEEESDDLLHRKCSPCTVHSHNDDGKETSLIDVVGSQGTGTLQQKKYLEAEMADRMNNNEERFQGDMAQMQGPHDQLETEVEQLLDSMEANASDCDRDEKHSAAELDQCSETQELSDIEDKWEGSADENRDSFSDQSDSQDELEDQEVQCLQVRESLDVDDQGICVDDQVSGDVSDEDEQEAKTVNGSGILSTHHQDQQNEILCFGGESGEHSRLALEEFRLKYGEICSVATAERMSSSCHFLESEMSSAQLRAQECKLPYNSEQHAAHALEDACSDHQEVLARRNKPISRVGAEDTLLCVKRKSDNAVNVSLLYNNGGIDNTNCDLGHHAQENVVHPGKEDSHLFTGTERQCHTLESGMTHASKELPNDPVPLQQKSTNGMSAPGCIEMKALEHEAVEQDDDMRYDVSVAFVQEPVVFGAEELDLIETDKSEVQSQNSQDEAHQASSEPEEDLGIDDDDDQSQSVDILGEAQPFLAGSIFGPPGARNYDFRLEDNYDSVDDKVESRDFIGDRGRDISDKLDPEILHLLELHLQKQQLVVIEEEEEEEEESDFDSFHVNAHKLHFESFGPSRKRGQLLDMVLEEPELLEEKEQEEDDLRDVQLEDTQMLNSEMKAERNPCEAGDDSIKYGASGGLNLEDVDIITTIDDAFKGASDNIIELTLHHGVQVELAGEDGLKCCSEGFSQLCKDIDHDDEPRSAIGELPDCNHTGHDIDESEVQAFELKSRLFAQLVDGTNSSGLRSGSLPFHCQQSRTISESKTCSSVCNAFRHEVDICDGMTVSSGGCKTTELSNMVCDDVTKRCGKKSLILTAEGREQATENAGWQPEMSSEQLVSSTLTTEYMNHVNAFIPRALESMSAELLSCQQTKISSLQQKTSRSRARTDLLGTAEVEQRSAEHEPLTAGHGDVKLPLRHLDGKQVEAEPRDRCLDPRTVPPRCSLEDAKAPSVEEALACCEKGPDIYQQLAEALEWAQASERRNSELHDELELLRARCETLYREKADLQRALMERETELKSFQIRKAESMLRSDEGAVANAPPRHPNETELLKTGSTHDAPTNEAADRSAGSKEAYRRSLMQAEFDALRQESRGMVEQLNSLQEDLKAFHHPRKPSNFMHHLFRTSLVAALGIILFWWGTKQLG